MAERSHRVTKRWFISTTPQTTANETTPWATLECWDGRAGAMKLETNANYSVFSVVRVVTCELKKWSVTERLIVGVNLFTAANLNARNVRKSILK